MNPLYLYINSLIHFAKEKYITQDEQQYTVRYYLLDKRFIKPINIDYLEAIMKGTKIKDLDSYYYQVTTLQYINNQNLYYTLDRYNLLISLDEFIEVIDRG